MGGHECRLIRRSNPRAGPWLLLDVRRGGAPDTYLVGRHHSAPWAFDLSGRSSVDFLPVFTLKAGHGPSPAQGLPVRGREFVAAGGLMSYLSSNAWHWRTAASFVDKILKGARPADIPVEQPTKFELLVNLKTAKALALTIPQSLLQRASDQRSRFLGRTSASVSPLAFGHSR
jgi:hypothetical protein